MMCVGMEIEGFQTFGWISDCCGNIHNFWVNNHEKLGKEFASISGGLEKVLINGEFLLVTCSC